MCRKKTCKTIGDSSMEKVLLTGITGFIGSHIAIELIKRGFSVYSVIRPIVGRELEYIKDLLDDVISLNADITDFGSMLNVLRTVDPAYIIHLAAYTPVRLSFEKPFTYMRVNLEGTMNIAESIRRLPDYKNRRLLFASTAEVYGYQNISEKKIKEDMPLYPSSPYAVSKAAADMYLRMVARVYDLDIVILRPVNTFGRKHETGFLVEYLITKMLRNEKVYIGAPESIRDYMYVDDHINAYLRAMEKGQNGQAYNIGTEQGITNRSLTIKIAEMIDYDQKNIIFGAYPPGYPLRPLQSDQSFIRLDATKAHHNLGWYPKYTLEEGLKEIICYYKSNANV